MTTDNGMDTEALPIGRDRTIICLQRRIRLLEGLLQMALQAMQDLPMGPLVRQELQEIEREISRVRTATHIDRKC